MNADGVTTVMIDDEPTEAERSVHLEIARAELEAAEAEAHLARARLARAEADVADVTHGASSQSPAPVATAEGTDGDQLAARSGWRGRRRLVGAAVAVVVVGALVAAGVVWRFGGSGLPGGVAYEAAGVRVTAAEFTRRTAVLEVLYRVQAPTDPAQAHKFRRDTAATLATSTVIYRAALAAGLSPAAGKAQQALDRFISERYPSDGQDGFTQTLAASHISKQDVLDEISMQLADQSLFDKVTAGITVSDADVRAAYDENPAAYAQPEQRQLRHIVVADQATAQKVLADLQHGADYASEVTTYSEDASTRSSGGELGSLTAGQLDPTFAAAAFGVGQGALFGPVQTSFGWHVGQVETIVPAKASTFDAAKSEVHDRLLADRSVAAWTAYLDKAKTKAHIRYASAYRPLPGDNPAPTAPASAQPRATAPSPSAS
jgi:peptidyl-prolyl cis-trans isomerase C